MKLDIIAIGASAGGISALTSLLGKLPRDLPAAIFVVLHVPPWEPSLLPQILSRSGPLPAAHAVHDEWIRNGRIYVAPPDHHMLIEEQRIELWRGPKENRNRPAVNTTFRSAAVSHGERVAGVVLSGSLDDGSAGLWWIQRYGGVAIVQDPNEATVRDMPCNALECVESAYVVGVSDMAALLLRLATGQTDEPRLNGSAAQEFQVWKQKRA